MKKKSAVCIAALTTILSLLLFGGCGGCGGPTEAAIDRTLPWDMDKVYEYSEFEIQRYMPKSENSSLTEDKILAEGKASFTLESAEQEGYTKLTSKVSLTFNNDPINGTDKGLTDTMTSEVIFDNKTLLPLKSQKTVNSAKRDGSEDLSYKTSVSYSDGTAEMQWLNRDTDTLQRKIRTGGQVFDNEQLFFAVRAFSSLGASSSQTFKLYQPFQAFIYDHDVYSMNMSVSGDKKERLLKNWIPSNNFGLEKDDDGNLKTECFVANLTLASSQSGPSIVAYYSASPFVITHNISTSKVMVGLTETSYGPTLSQTIKTDYSLVNYRAVSRPTD